MATGMKRFRVSGSESRAVSRSTFDGGSIFALPANVRIWTPEKAESYDIDIVPYVVTIPNHPDNTNGKIKEGAIWYRLPYEVHRSVGPNEIPVFSPKTFGRPDPIWEERQALVKKSYNDNKDLIKELTPQRMCVYVILDPADKSKFAIFPYSYFSFGKALDAEIDQQSEAVANFYDVNSDGMTVKARFSKESFNGGEYLKCTRVDFVKRAEIDEEWVLDNAPCLDTIFKELTYEQIATLHRGTGTPPVDGAATTSAPSGGAVNQPPAPRNRKTAAATPPPPPPPAAAQAPATGDANFPVGSRVTFKKAGQDIVGTVTEVDGEDREVEGDNGTKYDVDVDDLSAGPAKAAEAAKPGKGAKAAEPSTPPASGPRRFAVGDAVTVTIKGNAITGKVINVDEKGEEYTIEDAKGSETDVDFDDPTLQPATAGGGGKDAAAPATGGTIEVGSRVKADNGKTGTVKKINGDEVKVTLDGDGGTEKFDIDDLSLLPAGGGGGGAADRPIAVGDSVTWDEGTESGTVTKIHPTGEKFKIKNASGEEAWVLKSAGVQLA